MSGMSRRELLAGAAAVGVAAALPATAEPVAAAKPMKQVLAIGDVSTGYQHESVSHALATMERLGRASGEFAMTIRTDSQLITKQPVWGTGKYAAPPEGSRKTNAKNLNDFDAVFFYGIGEGTLSAQQKADLLSFVHDDGKGFVGAHTAIDAFYSWREYGEMMGGYFDNHPWGVADGAVIVEEPSFPGWTSLGKTFPIRDEFYMTLPEPYSRSKVDVIARLDASKMDLTKPGLRKDLDFPVAWAKTYGKGNVFWSTFGHPVESWDDPRVQGIYMGALRWALGLREYAVQPHGMTA
jgi:type 1 glutamine amidotransferase